MIATTGLQGLQGEIPYTERISDIQAASSSAYPFWFVHDEIHLKSTCAQWFKTLRKTGQIILSHELVSARANERSRARERCEQCKRMSERCEGTSKQKSEWPSTDKVLNHCDVALMWRRIRVKTHRCKDVKTRWCEPALMWRRIDVKIRFF